MIRVVAIVSLGCLLVLVLYLPVLIVYGPGQLVYHETMLSNSWADFQHKVIDNTLVVWADLSSTTASWVGILGLAGLVFAAYISGSAGRAVCIVPPRPDAPRSRSGLLERPCACCPSVALATICPRAARDVCMATLRTADMCPDHARDRRVL